MIVAILERRVSWNVLDVMGRDVMMGCVTAARRDGGDSTVRRLDVLAAAAQTAPDTETA